MKKTLATFAVFLLPLYFSAQEINITGNVKSENGSSVSGVNITDKNTGKTAITDENGNFSIKLNHDTLHTIYVNDEEYGRIKIEGVKKYGKN